LQDAIIGLEAVIMPFSVGAEKIDGDYMVIRKRDRDNPGITFTIQIHGERDNPVVYDITERVPYIDEEGWHYEKIYKKFHSSNTIEPDEALYKIKVNGESAEPEHQSQSEIEKFRRRHRIPKPHAFAKTIDDLSRRLARSLPYHIELPT
jgi:hypothetical protein